ncbi:hypothetical protein ACF0H5_017767 [Mactra antiquata]
MDQTNLHPECNSCEENETCEDLGNGTIFCFIRECQSSPSTYNHATIVGNNNAVGSKRTYQCNSGKVTIGKATSKCLSSGNWLSPNFSCAPLQCWSPNIHQDFYILNITTESDWPMINFRCHGNTITRGTPLSCGTNGSYVYLHACCDEPDSSEWVKIFRVNTAGEMNSRSFLLYEREIDDVRTGCQFRRADLIDNWQNEQIEKVKVELKVGDQVMAWIIFDGQNTTKETWFSAEHLLNSSWNDLTPMGYFDAFSMVGLADNGTEASGEVCTKTEIVTETKIRRTKYLKPSNIAVTEATELSGRAALMLSQISNILSECPIGSNGAPSSACIDSNNNTRVCRDYVCDRSGFVSPPSVISIKENDNEAKLLWKVNATCFYQTKEGDVLISRNVQARNCSVRSTHDLVFSKGLNIYRKACSNPSCVECSNDVGCLDYPQEYKVEVMCYVNLNGMGLVEHTFTIATEEAEEVEFNIGDEDLKEPVTLITGTPGTLVRSFQEIKIPQDESVTFQVFGPKTDNGEPYFEWNYESNEVVVATDLYDVPPGLYGVEVCAIQRRSEKCTAFTVILDIPRTTTTTTPNTDFTVADETLTTNLPRCQPVTLPTPVPTKPPKLKPCKSWNTWETIPGMNFWCQVTCSTLDDDCRPYENHCICLNSTVEHLTCHARGNKWKGNEDMDAWCQLNCNYGNYSHCPTRKENKEGYCVCTEGHSESSTEDQDDSTESQDDESNESQEDESTESKNDDLTESSPDDSVTSPDDSVDNSKDSPPSSSSSDTAMAVHSTTSEREKFSEDSQTEIPAEYGSSPTTGQSTSPPNLYED